MTRLGFSVIAGNVAVEAVTSIMTVDALRSITVAPAKLVLVKTTTTVEVVRCAEVGRSLACGIVVITIIEDVAVTVGLFELSGDVALTDDIGVPVDSNGEGHGRCGWLVGVGRIAAEAAGADEGVGGDEVANDGNGGVVAPSEVGIVMMVVIRDVPDKVVLVKVVATVSDGPDAGKLGTVGGITGRVGQITDRDDMIGILSGDFVTKVLDRLGEAML